MTDEQRAILTRQKAELVKLMTSRKQAYSLVFGDQAIQSEKNVVWADLARFCRDKETCFHPDPRIHAALEGRREVFLRIRDYVELSVDELCQKYGRASE